MIPVYAVPVIRDADRTTVRKQEISSWQLMERAADACVDYMVRHLCGRDGNSDKCAGSEDRRCFHVFCGKGNNGGDGLAIARILDGRGYRVKVWITSKEGAFSPDAFENLRKLRDSAAEVYVFGKGPVKINEDGRLEEAACASSGNLPQIVQDDIAVDALVGTGLKGELDAVTAEIVRFLNRLAVCKFSVDIPSGLLADAPTPREWTVVEGSFCLSFQFPKQAFLFPESENRPFGFALLDIGIDPEHYRMHPPQAALLQEQDVRPWILPRGKFSHKGNYGKALSVAGSEGMAGAAVLAGKAALKTGCGLLYTASDKANRVVLQSCIPEAIFEDRENLDGGRMSTYSAIGVGSGMGTGRDAARCLHNILQYAESPLILDADALTLLSQNPTWLEFLPKGKTVITPHPGEFARLAGRWHDSWERTRMQQQFSDRYGAIVVLKGAHTCITIPGGGVPAAPTMFNTTGNPGMAAAGSGDVLSGMLLSLAAQGYPLVQASYMAVFLHGLAGDLAAERLTEYALCAGDIVEHIPEAYKTLLGIGL